MSRNKLIQQYAPILNSNLPQRIFDTVNEYIKNQGIGNIPHRQINGFSNGELYISESLSLPISLEQFDFKCDLISICRIDKQGDVYVDMNKILRAVDWWKDRIYNLHENEYYSIKGEDENFKPHGYNIINLAVFNEDFDLHGNKQFVPAIHDSESFDIQILADYVDSMRDYDQNEDECGEDDDCDEPGEYYWDNLEYDYIDNYWEYQDAIGDKYSGWAAFLYNIRSGAFGELPDDYDGLSWID